MSRRAPALVEAAVTVEVPGGTGTIACVADTHSAPHPAIGARLAELRPVAIFHAGDIGELSVLDELRAYAPVYAVRGNIDTRARDLPDVLLVDLVRPPAGTVRVLLTHIAVYGPRLRREIVARAQAAGAALVVCGHSHVPFIGRDRGLAMFNPGSIGPRRFTLPIVFGTIAITPTRIDLAHLDCATGAPWSPP